MNECGMDGWMGGWMDEYIYIIMKVKGKNRIRKSCW
jgi:hypothetical protein